MSLSVSKNKYFYFTISGSKRIYLGTSDNPQEKNVDEAMQHLNDKIKKYEDERQKLQDFLPEKKQETFNIGYKVVIFDLDGVIFDKPWHHDTSDEVAVSTWDVLFQELGIYDSHEKLKKQFEEGVFKTYMEWTEAACNILKSFRLDHATFEKIINQRPFMQGAKDVFEILQKNKVIIAVITGSFEELAQRANKELGGISNIFAHCEFHFDKKGYLDSCKLQETDYNHKASFVKQISKKYGISTKQFVYIGDDVNDISAFKEVGLSIAFNSNKMKVNQAAKVVIDSRNLKSILPHLYVNDEATKIVNSQLIIKQQ